MKLRQRQIVEVLFRLPPDGKVLNHPCIIISNEDINEEEQAFVGVMITSEKHYKGDNYSFELTPIMLTKPMDKDFSAVRLHLVSLFLKRDIITNRNVGNEIRKSHFERLLSQINSVVFDTDL
jgi:PemK-like, MazF-like toxin of type II toxin-antitoxin system